MEYGTQLRRFLTQLFNIDVQVIEWGLGLIKTLGAPISPVEHTFIVPAERYQDALSQAEQCGFEREPLTTQCAYRYGQLGQRAAYYCVPATAKRAGLIKAGDHGVILFSTEDISVDLGRVTPHPAVPIWRPDKVEAFRLFLLATCFNHDQTSGQRRAAGFGKLLLLFVLHGGMDVTYIPKCTVENETCEDDPATTRQTIAKVRAWDWAADQGWLCDVLVDMILGNVDSRDFNSAWLSKRSAPSAEQPHRGAQ